MRRHTWSTAVTLCFAAALAAAASAPSQARPTAPAASHTVRQQARVPVLVDCFWHADVRPTAFVLACGDGNSRLASMHWSQWGRTAAKARGVNIVNDCKPYCAAGRFHAYHVFVRLDHPKHWKKHPRLQHYTRMTLVYQGARPDTFPRTVTYPLWN
ncbi:MULTISPECIES: hypothetical protein [unclassified Streptomyces]|uniref:hypothetical protein n=1 Tax=unclassified Streptomyces TaxID=2593676 RepID=UPI00224F7997|nr:MULTISPECIES: hypothetical protein [unclassified Streptomyces]MCX5053909.1 hypothetical protein [Streptomyces sp. NBC_00474]